MEEQVVLCNESGEAIGLQGKQAAHEAGNLHRAISVLIYNSKGEMLLQRRALSKYHWAGIWSNACCTHPRDGESFEAAASRRLMEELGFECPITEIHRFVYKAFDAESGLTEHEYDVVFEGQYEGEIPFNPDEVDAVQWISIPDLKSAIEQRPEEFSFWFKTILEQTKLY